MKKIELIKTCQSYIGMREGTERHRQFVNDYNSKCVPLARNYPLKYSDSWCASFVSLCLTINGENRFNEVGCQEMRNKFKKLSAFTTDLKNVSKGDVVFYDWDCNGWVEHVGIIEEIQWINSNRGVLTVIEGNKSDAVGRRTIESDDKNVAGFGIIHEDSVSEDVEDIREIQKWFEKVIEILERIERKL